MSIHFKYGGSGASRLLQCPGNLQAVERLTKVSGGSSYAARGTALHEIQEKLQTEGLRPQDISITEMFPSLTPEEVADYEENTQLIYDWTEKLLDKYQLDFIICEPLVKAGRNTGGSIDLVAYNDDICMIIDYKFGSIPVHAKDNAQGLFYHWALNQDPRYTEINEGKELIFAILQPDQGEPDVWEMPHDAVSEFTIKYSKAVELSKKMDAPLSAGPYCKFCGNAPYCDEKIKYAQRALTLDPKQKEDLVQCLELATLLKGWEKTVYAEAESILKAGESVSGYKLVEKRAMRQWGNEQAVIDVLTELPEPGQYFSEPKLLSPAKFDKIKLPNEVKVTIKDNIVKRSSGVTLAPDSDKRPAVNAEVPEALKNLIKK